MKVCMISTNHDLFDDRIYWKEAISLKKHGYDVFCIAISDKGETGITNEGIKYHKIKSKGKKYKNIFKRNIFYNETFSCETFEEIFNIAKDLKCNVYHFHDLYLNLIGKRLKRLPFKPKVIYDVHESYIDLIRDYRGTKGFKTVIKVLYSMYVDLWEKTNSKEYDFIITADDATSNYFKNTFNINNVDIIYNFTNLHSISNHKKMNNSAYKYYDAIYCGGITKVRGLFQILEAINIGKSYNKNLKVAFLGPLGEHNLKMEIAKYINSNDLQDNVHFLGKVTYEKVPNYLTNSKLGLVTLLPIKKFHKNIPIKQFEYMAFGLPIIGSDLPPIKKFVGEYNCGKLVNPLNPKEIWEAIEAILSNEELYNLYSNNGIKASENNCNWDVMEEKLLKIYSEILR
ncbi:glycosyltransferase family 4 protein [Clostridium botulinum]|uniref:glycosyltransferase family 4 protein n=1 Tax=Clostridium botulinum TaxID=1491 RepID=UPI000A1761AC|nr:glycosyltransferase family 4 protein [Clostridium botulinum]MBY6800469.1 glycosyltransferase family 4 protein [Clostridium botulinum]NFF18349.1 glycosyltransferase family 4 protein [Clostridium botulinum]NFM75577.1 glycosyltransferase family 4 protein [Clostridium botulinum]NFP96164.1 glycosyltransferase family 4 protein [Clostridium botulinum]NFS36080.1 glycosyltransferase family 4 protein [Clostridium botulinum]